MAYAVLDVEQQVKQRQRSHGSVEQYANIGIGVGRLVPPRVGIDRVRAPGRGIQS